MSIIINGLSLSNPQHWTLGRGLLDSHPGASAAFSIDTYIYSSYGDNPTIRVRRDSDNSERDFTPLEINNGDLELWVTSRASVNNPLLDVHPNAAGAYSLRNLSSSYTGPVIRARRSVDNVESDFTTLEIEDGTLESWTQDVSSILDQPFLEEFPGAKAAYSLRQLGVDPAAKGTTLPGDFGPGAVGSYSLRYVNQAWADANQPVVRVRRGIDDVEQDFTPQEIEDGTLRAFVGKNLIQSSDLTFQSVALGEDDRSITPGILDPEGGNNANRITFINNDTNTNVNVRFLLGVQQGDVYNYPNNKMTMSVWARSTSGQITITIDISDETGKFIIDEVWRKLVVTVDQVNFSGNGDTTKLFADIYINETIVPIDIYNLQVESSDSATDYQAPIGASVQGAGYVTTLYDQSGNNQHVTQNTSNLQPTLVTAGKVNTHNGRPIIWFRDTGDSLSFNNFSVNNTSAISSFSSAFGEFSNSTGPLNIIGSVGEADSYIITNEVAIRTGAGALQLNPFDNVQSNAAIVSGFHTGNGTIADLTGFVNGQDKTLSYNNPSTSLDLGSNTTFYIGTGELVSVEQHIQEVIIYDTDQIANREAVEFNMNSYYEAFDQWDGDHVIKLTNTDGDTRKFTADEIGNSPEVLENWVKGLPDNHSVIGTLDHLPGARVAYSPDVLLYSNYTGPSVRVRRGTDDAEQDFTYSEVADGSLEAWVNQTNGFGFVHTLYDQSGNNINATQTQNDYQPLIVNGGSLVTENGKAAITFDGVDDYMDTSDYIMDVYTNAVSVVTVHNSDNSQYMITEADSYDPQDSNIYSSSIIYGDSNGDASVWFNSVISSGIINGSQMVSGFRYNHSQISSIVNNSHADTTAPNEVLPTVGNKTTIGARLTGEVNYEGNLQCIVTYYDGTEQAYLNASTAINKAYQVFDESKDGLVDIWYDQSGNENHGLQDIEDEKPKLVENGTITTKDSIPAISLDNIDDSLSLGFAAGTPDYWYTFSTVNFNANNTVNYVYDGRDGSGDGPVLFAADSGGNQLLNSRVDNTSNQGTVLPLQTFIATQEVNNTVVHNLYINSVLEDTEENPTTINTNTTISLGKASYVNVGTTNGNIFEFIVYDTNQALTRSGIEANINAYYSVHNNGLNSYVSTIYDQSSNGNNITQSIASLQPQIIRDGSVIIDGVTNKPIIYFDGIDDTMTLDSQINDVDSLLLVASAEDDFGHILEGLSTYMSLRNVNIRFISQNAGGSQTFETIDTTADTYLTSLFNARMLYKNGEISTFDITGYPGGQFNVNSLSRDSAPDKTNFSELILYTSDELSSRTSLEANINEYYNLYTTDINGYVSTWYDQSGNENHATQTVANAQPKIVDAGSLVVENGKAALEFDEVANSTLGFNPDLVVTSNFMYIGVYANISSSAGYIFRDSPQLGRRGNGQYRFYSSGFSINEGSHSPNQVLIIGQETAGTVSVYVDSLEIASDTSVFTSGDLTRLGFTLQGKVNLAMVYNSDQSANRESIETMLNNYYNIY